MGMGQILVIEDDADTLDLMASGLKDEGFAIKTAVNGLVASYLIDNYAFAAIVSDIKLPGVNGLQVAANIRRSNNNRHAPIIIVSGFIDAEAVARLAALKISKMFAKPLEVADLVKELRRVLPTEPESAPKAASKVTYDVRLINAVVSAVTEVLVHHLGQDFKTDPVFIKTESHDGHFATSMISLTGNGLQGSLALSFQKAFLEGLHSSIYAGLTSELSEDSLGDIAAEICNQVSGRIKIKLSKLGLKILIGLPELVTGLGHKVRHKTSNPVLAVPLFFRDARCTMEFCFTKCVIEEITDESDAAVSLSDVILFD